MNKRCSIGAQMMRLAVLLAGITAPLFAQQTISLKQAQDSAVKRSPAVQAAALQTIQSRQLQKSSVSIPNPDVLAESPTGEFYTIGVQQSFDFPGTYIRQNQYQKGQTKLAGFGKTISELEVKREVALLYLDLQYQQARLVLLAKQDSLYKSLSDAADRQQNGGQLDFIQKTYVNLQYGSVHLNYEAAKTDFAAAAEQLRILTGITGVFTTDSLTALLRMERPQITLSANPYLGYFDQQVIVNQRLLQAERNRFFPGFTIGYLNQGPLNTPLMYRFRAGITVPLWFWQYNGRIQAAKTGIRIAELQGAARQQELSVQLINARAAQTKATAALIYYEETGLRQAQEIEAAAGRLFTAGATDYTTYLRTLNEAYTLRLNHIEAVKNYNAAVIQLNYLSGNP